jgi:hypothetical protein
MKIEQSNELDHMCHQHILEEENLQQMSTKVNKCQQNQPKSKHAPKR